MKATTTLRQLRQSRGLTQQQLAERSGIAQSKISQYETGVVVPRLSAARRLADALGVSTDDLTPQLTQRDVLRVLHDDLQALRHEIVLLRQAIQQLQQK